MKLGVGAVQLVVGILLLVVAFFSNSDPFATKTIYRNILITTVTIFITVNICLLDKTACLSDRKYQMMLLTYLIFAAGYLLWEASGKSVLLVVWRIALIVMLLEALFLTIEVIWLKKR
ncbi:MAG: hypothetical protein GXN93_01060 [Candidatus Diapherotrites archaeon]|nr:hypothetical protein [Candidatus Diapherotrites archaeon]